MLKTHHFFRQFEKLKHEDKFSMIEAPAEPTSLFLIFKQLTEVRAQKKFFEDREKQLLKLAEIGFNQLEKKE